MGLDIHRISELKQKLHPNEKLRAWYASHTFGGTTKAKSLKILGFNKKNFYYIAAGFGILIILGGAGAGIAVQQGLVTATQKGAAQGIKGDQVIAQTTQTRARTYVSAGSTIITTETTAFATTYPRGGGGTEIKATNSDGQEITVPGDIQFVTNTDGNLNTVTRVGSTFMVTNGDIVEATTLFGTPTVTTQNGVAVATTVFDGLSLVTGADGEIATSIAAPSPPSSIGASVTGTSSGTSAATASSSGTSSSGAASSSSGASSSSASSSSSSSASSSKSASASSTSAAAGGGGDGGGDGELFEGEATFYAPGLGSCGTDATDADFVAALSKVLFDATGATNSNANPYCGRKALIMAAGGGAKMRRWEHNIASGGFENWERSRSMKEERRSVLKGPILPSGTVDQFSNGSLIQDYVPMPGITAPPDSRKIAKRQAGGGGVTVTIVDRCPVCKEHDLDLSPAAYNVLGDENAGRIPIEWKWLD